MTAQWYIVHTYSNFEKKAAEEIKRQAQIPPQGQARLPEALQRLMERYEATGQTEKAAEWRQKLKSGGASERPSVDR